MNPQIQSKDLNRNGIGNAGRHHAARLSLLGLKDAAERSRARAIHFARRRAAQRETL